MPHQENAKYRALFEENLESLNWALDYVCNRYRMSEDDDDDFCSWAILKLMENDFKAYRMYDGRSGWPTYLAAVVCNLARDYRVEKWGRYRPSRTARQRGETAILLETLVRRDGYSQSEAVALLAENHGVAVHEDDLALLSPLPASRLERRVEPIDAIDDLPDRGTRRTPQERLEQDEIAKTLAPALQECLEALEPEDRLLLKLRFVDGLTVASIARSLGMNQRRLYTRFSQMLRELREKLNRGGVRDEQVVTVLDGPPCMAAEAELSR